MRILTIIGTRPEAVKMAPIIQELARHQGVVESVVVSTGQHREMLDQMFELFDITPDIELDIMRPNQSPSLVAARVLQGLDRLFEQRRPHWLLVQGDTTTVMAAGIAAHHRRVRVGHVEAGLRTYDRMNPFPEEMNRVVADHVSDMHFAPTEQARDNLLREGIDPCSVFVTGNTVVDALLQIAAQPPPPEVEALLDENKTPVLVTAHRRENHGPPLERICQALRRLAARGDVQIIYPVHQNPNVCGPVHEQLDGVPGIHLTPPLDYASLVHLMKCSRLVLTDSGGIQEEAPTLGVPVLVLREVTERPEAVAAGTVSVVGTDAAAIVREAARLLDDDEAHRQMARATNPYGDGTAARRIIGHLLDEGTRT